MNTKIKLFISLVIIACTSVLTVFDVKAQNRTARSGIKGGFNVSNLYVSNVDDENARFGFNAGLYGQILSSEVFAIQPELLYSTKGAQTEYHGVLGDQVTKFNLNYLEVPVLAVIKLGKSAEIHAGGYAAYLLAANIKNSGDFSNGTNVLDRDNFKAGDAGLVGGFGLNFGSMQIGARYNYGMVEIANSSAARNLVGNSKNSTASLYVAFDLRSKD